MGVDLSVEIGGIRMKNPVMVASGTFGYGPEYADLVDLNRLGAALKAERDRMKQAREQGG